LGTPAAQGTASPARNHQQIFTKADLDRVNGLDRVREYDRSSQAETKHRERIMVNTGGRVENTKNEHGKVRMHALLLIAAATLTACGGNGSGGSVSVPNVVGDTQTAASTAITGAGLMVGTVTQASSATVASGNVISETPAAGTSAASGSSVALIVSTGPASVSVPNVVGDAQAAASTALTSAGLTVGTVTRQSSSSVASGDVISENPAAATSVAKGSAVALVVSSGPPTYTIGGTLIGLAPSATVHVLNGADNKPISANGSFTLPTAVVSGGNYSITVGTPTSAQTCGVQNGAGTVASANVTTVVVYCTYNVTAGTLNTTFTSVGLAFDIAANNSTINYDYVSTDTFNGVSAISSTLTLNVGGTIVPGQMGAETYAVTTADAIPTYTDNSPGLGGIEGVNGDAIITAENMTSGSEPGIYLAVLPNTNATTASINGTYAAVVLRGDGNGHLLAREGSGLTLSNGNISGSLTTNDFGTLSSVSVSSTYSVSAGLITTGAELIPALGNTEGNFSGAVSADGDLIVMADLGSGDPVTAAVLLQQGIGVTAATFNGVYSVVQYGGHSPTAPDGRAATVFAYGNGTWSIIYTENTNQGTITTNNTGSGTYTVTANGTLTLTDAGGDVSNGAISADGNTLVFGWVTSGLAPEIGVGVRQ
jgi:PASTA domain